MSSAVQFLHRERLPASGCLVVPGKLDAPDLATFQQLFHGRPITWLIEENAPMDPEVRDFLGKSGSGAVFSDDDEDPAAVGDQLKGALKDNGVLVFVPGPGVARANTPCHIPGKTLTTLGKFRLPTLPVGMDSPRDTTLSVDKSSNLPRVVFALGELISESKVSGATIREGMLVASQEAYSARNLFKGSLAMAVLQGLKKHSKTTLFDGADDSVLTFDKLLAAALVFSKYLREATDAPRIGIVLPPGKAGMVANLAVVFAGKVPVNFNFTASHEAVRSAMKQSGVDRYITADPFVRKVASFPWPPNRDLIHIERVLPLLKKKIVAWTILAKLLPASTLAALFGVGKRKGDDEAVLLFTSGSSGDPKGVVLSHRNVLGNVCQFGSRLEVGPGDRILGCLPLFHSFGSTVTLWFPCIEGLDLVTYPNPLETKRLGELIEARKVSLLLATPTFLRGYMKRVKPEQLQSVKLVVTGAEKLPENLADAFHQRFQIRPLEGYGLTETSPVTNVNLPEPSTAGNAVVLPSSRQGTVGQMLPGIAVRLTDPATDLPCPIDRQGIIWFRGVNIFPGYLDNPKKSAEVIHPDGWFRTGDVGRVDEDGFLRIEGRISRFSKIAGEMVPHETVEAAINKALGLDSEAERKIAIVGVPDEQKGEAIILLSTLAGPALEQECIDLRYKLMDAGVPSLWCPRAIVPVTEIPVLASGKLDLKGCQLLAER
ncbi:acyl-[acyl-carrier-protein]-phospholipid O-acyltransferase/long-chain-fatty-acid--[acyl-carrier-protein] ligase [Haloferula luteola]|uniref:Acyl-[acyl-carrier-protein]-phospholipid O-acyltransferase/long-chain-fatty-acid--[acyl-carrier-protein] ligase n=1 Tax=Haloferula luteola TaxID=595692 RepID=A0A840UXZ3_9BACT|nr:AMP-binding protein [Haloferula luteola]MBB5349823.1 acyl-[acyl-carrier-protein]-phospholipid O-acyltransferase/long-chain-fatty-acid--[acyl-carrier-protein] ligase [Haloferula luteola]